MVVVNLLVMDGVVVSRVVVDMVVVDGRMVGVYQCCVVCGGSHGGGIG